MIIYIYLVFFHHCMKSKMAAGGHFEKKIWSLFFNATIWFGQFQAKKKKKKNLPLKKKKILRDLEKFLEIFRIFFDFFFAYCQRITLSFMCIAVWSLKKCFCAWK